MKKIVEGKLESKRINGIIQDIIHIKDEPFAKLLEDFDGHYVSLSFSVYSDDRTVSLKEWNLFGQFECEYMEYASEIWDVIEIVNFMTLSSIDMMKELSPFIGCYLLLSIDDENEKEKERVRLETINRSRSLLNNFDENAEKLGISREELIQFIDKK